MTDQDQAPQVDVRATLTCPVCGTKEKVVMPIEQLQHYFKCTNQECLADLAPLPGKDCVFCSYADKPCPPRQLNPDLEVSKLRSLL